MSNMMNTVLLWRTQEVSFPASPKAYSPIYTILLITRQSSFQFITYYLLCRHTPRQPYH